MKRKAFLLALTTGMLSGTASAENGWGNLGGILQQACSASQGNAAGMSFNTGKFGEKMQWLCQLQNIHGFIDNNILNGDWEAFAQDVAGKYLGQLANYIGDSMGDTSGVSHLLAGLNDAMNRNYGDFKQALYGTAVRGIGPGRSLNAGYSEGSVGNIAEKAIANNPTFALANSVARVSDAMNAAHGVQKAYQAKKIQEVVLQKILQAALRDSGLHPRRRTGGQVTSGLDDTGPQTLPGARTPDWSVIASRCTG
ncbi:hypothetical protein, partial [Deinococcus fonticola]|uniref:hypothetical protein n=1 Tax=Deinococcus fonticola TaxID=2528713 RepID=UPI001074EF51